jgi:hypothetical protein
MNSTKTTPVISQNQVNQTVMRGMRRNQVNQTVMRGMMMRRRRSRSTMIMRTGIMSSSC